MDPHTESKRQPKPVPLAARAPPKHLRLSVDSAASTSSTSHSSRYESQKRRDWNSFLQYLKSYKPSPLTLAHCKGSHVLEYLKYLDQFGKTKVHAHGCAYFGHPNPPARCPCPLRQAWGSLDSLIGRLRAAYGETGGQASSNPFAATTVRVYLREVRNSQAKARGIVQVKKKCKWKPEIVSPIPLSSPPPQPQRKKSVDDCRRTLPSPEYS